MSGQSEQTRLFGPTRRWKIGDVLYAENDWVRMAYVVTADPAQVGKLTVRDERFVQYIDAATAGLWDGAEERERA